MNKVIEFLKENPVQYLATVGRDGKAKCRPFMFAGEMDGNCGSAQITQKMFIWICRATRKLKFLFPAHLMHGFACMEKPYLKTTWLQKKCVLPIRLSKDSMRLRIIRFLRYFT